MIRAVVFDIDDTLYGFPPLHKKALGVSYVIYKKHENISLDEFEKDFEKRWELLKSSMNGTPSMANRALIFQNMVERRLGKFDYNLILELYNSYWGSLLENLSPFDGVSELFSYLKQKGIKIGLITDLTTVIQLRKISRMKLHVDVFVGSEECGVTKPAAPIFNKIIEKLDVSPEEIVMVGDNPSKDIAGAKWSGMRTILITKKDGGGGTDYSVREFTEIKEILEKLINTSP